MSTMIDSVLKGLAFVGTVDTVVLVIIIIWSIILWMRGIFPALLRLGNGLARRKIAIFAKGDNMVSLNDLLSDSGLFNNKNILKITSAGDFGRAEEASVYLVYWHDWINEIDKITGMKPDKCSLIVYSPYDEDKIPTAEMKKLDGKRNSTVTNFRGRLLNDIITAMITTSYKK